MLWCGIKGKRGGNKMVVADNVTDDTLIKGSNELS